MPRIRTIKPEFWGDEKLAPLDPLTRLVFLGLVCMADDAGRLLDNVKSIDGFLFPETSDTSRDALDTLARLSRITRYTLASGSRVIQVTHWEKHQKVDRPSRYVLPAEESRDARESPENPRVTILDLGPRTLDPDHGPTNKEHSAHAPPRANGERKRKPPPPPPDWAVVLADHWISRAGSTTPAKVASALKTVVAAHGEALILRAMDGWLDARVGQGKEPNIAWFAGVASHWVARTAPLVDEHGIPNERGAAILSGTG